MTDPWIIVCGGRDFGGSPEAALWLNETVSALKPAGAMHGNCRGADQWAARVLQQRFPKLRIEARAAEWSKYAGQRPNPAGFIRNRRMEIECNQLGKLVACIAFPGGGGTADMCAVAQAAGATILRF